MAERGLRQTVAVRLLGQQAERTIKLPEAPDPDLRSLVQINTGPLSTRLEYDRDPNTGMVTGYRECSSSAVGWQGPVLAGQVQHTTQHHLYGQMTSTPYLPAGMEHELDLLLNTDDGEQQPTAEADCTALTALNAEGTLLDTPPGWPTAVEFDEAGSEETTAAAAADSPQDEPAEHKPAAAETDEFLELMDLVTDVGDLQFGAETLCEETYEKLTINELPSVPASEQDEEQTHQLEEVLSRPAPLVVSVDAATRSQPAADKPEPATEATHATVLDVSRPPEQYKALRNNMAKQYPFELDPWQQHAVVCLERGDSVFVAAHTSAGKTVVAEYAIALCEQHNTRAVYTSPIKALSNQKFHDFKQQYSEVGLITGDIQLHHDAFCLVMTTEILRSMLYNGSELIRELEWVIFDEVHYINDAERGVVWEEVLIMLPSHVKIIMLSATAPNSKDFAEWVGCIKKRQIYVITTSKRPVPLEHYIYTGQDGKTKNERFLVVDQNGRYMPLGYKKALDAIAQRKKQSGRGRGRGGPMGHAGGNSMGAEKGLFIALFDHLSTNDQLPVVIFTFSRRRCDSNAAMLTSVDLTTAMEKRSIHNFFTKCINRLKGSDKRLPQVLQMQEICKRGLAVHHSGILPILKEVVEMLFQQGFVKILFATETFAMGVNMPARTVVFDEMRKHDGTEKRDLLPGEYTQMAGRAGRRGLDSTGTVIVLCKQGRVPDSSDLVKMMLGTPTKLASHFRVTYGLLLNVLRVEQLRVEDVLRRSYAESRTLKSTMSRKQRLVTLNKDHSDAQLVWPECEMCSRQQLTDYNTVSRGLITSEQRCWKQAVQQQAASKTLSPGRLLIVNLSKLARRLPAILFKLIVDEAGQRKCDLFVAVPESLATQLDDASQWPWRQQKLAAAQHSGVDMHDWDTVAVLQQDAIAFGTACSDVNQLGEGRLCERLLCDVPVEYVHAVCQLNIKLNTLQIKQDIMQRMTPRFRNQSPDGCVRQLIHDLQRVSAEWSQTGVPIIRSIEFMTNEVQQFELKQEVLGWEAQLSAVACVRCPLFKEHFAIASTNFRLLEERDRLLHSLSTASLLLKPEFDSKIRVLRAMGFIDAEHLVQLKAKVACELHNQELLITELMLENSLQGLSCAEVAALLSCITCQHKDEANLDAHMKKLFERIESVAKRMQEAQRVSGVTDREDDVTLSLRSALMRVVYEWANGMPFADIMSLTEAQEGNIVRCIQRLDETLRDVRNAARMVGDTALAQLMTDTSTAIKRDIVFAASLWTQ